MYTLMCKAMEAYPLSGADGALCGVSGGADSAALLHAMTRLGAERGFPVYAAHYHHGIRGPEADRDESFVREYCASLGVRLLAGRGDAPALAEREGIPLEQAARRLRYGFFGEALAECGAKCVAVAHHADDQAETVLMHIMRGSGVHGVRGMDFLNDTDYGYDVIRPLLAVRRAGIEDYIAANRLAYVTDSTNLEPDARRNRVRLELIPYMERYFNANIVDSLGALARFAAEDDDCLDRMAAAALKPLRSGFDRAALAALDRPVRVRALFLLLEGCGARVDIERRHIEAADALLTAVSGSAIDLPGVTLRVSGGCITAAPVPESAEWSVPFDPAGFDTPEGRVDCRPWTGGFTEAAQAIDLDKLPADAVVRNRRPGDTVRPVGAPGTKKLKEFFIDKKIPKELRDGLPLLCSGSRVMAVLGVCCAGEVMVDADTQRALLMEYTRR